MGPVDSDRITRVPPYSGYFKEIDAFRWQDFHLLWFSFPSNLAMHQFSYSYIEVLQPQIRRFGLGYFLFARHYLGNRVFFLFLFLLRCFSSEGYFLISYGFTNWYLRITTSEFPHSEIPGSKLTYSSPRHFVVSHVLHQLLMPSDPHVRPY